MKQDKSSRNHPGLTGSADAARSLHSPPSQSSARTNCDPRATLHAPAGETRATSASLPSEDLRQRPTAVRERPREQELGERGGSTTDSSRPPSHRELVRRGLTLAVLGLVLVALVFAVPSLRQVRHDVGALNLWWTLAAIGLEVASCVSFVVVFRAFFDEIPARLARHVAWLEEGSGALLPGGGVTSYALGGVFLHRAGMSFRRIVERSGGLFWFTSAVNAAALVLGAILFLLHESQSLQVVYAVAPAVLALPLTIVIAASPLLVKRLWRLKPAPAWLTGLTDGVADAWRAARNPSWRLLAALGYLGFDMAVLACLFRGLDYHISLGTLILGYLVGYCAAAIPIPAGIGVLEGGLLGAFLLYGAPGAKTAVAVLMYHAIAFWIPSLGGLGAYLPILREAHRHESAISVNQPLPARDRPA